MPIAVRNHFSTDAPHTRFPPLVIAHRGASAMYPENTMPAFAAGIDQGADMIEIDVHMNRDGDLIVIHDSTLDRTTNVSTVFPDHGESTAGAMSTAQIAALDAGSWKDQAFAGTRVPHLAEVLELVHATRTGLLLEVKQPAQYPGIAEVIAETLLAASDYLERALVAGMLVVQSCDWDFVRQFHGLVPEIPVAVLGRPSPNEMHELASWVDQINPEHTAADSRYLDLIHELGMSSLLWTVDGVSDMEAAIDIGADGIITNLPDRLVQLVEEI